MRAPGCQAGWMQVQKKKKWLWKSHLRNLSTVSLKFRHQLRPDMRRGISLRLLLPFLFLQPWHSGELEFTCWPLWWRCCQLTVTHPHPPASCCQQESNNSQVPSHQNVYFQHVASVPLIHLYREYHHLMAMGSNAAAQLLSEGGFSDLRQRSLLILNCVAIKRNVNYYVKTEGGKVKSCTAIAKNNPRQPRVQCDPYRGVLPARDLFTATKTWSRRRGKKEEEVNELENKPDFVIVSSALVLSLFYNLFPSFGRACKLYNAALCFHRVEQHE